VKGEQVGVVQKFIDLLCVDGYTSVGVPHQDDFVIGVYPLCHQMF
jgi:hypothetical protein